MKEFGKNTEEEEDILDRVKAREIIQTVLDYGVNQAQMYQMIFLLSLELENQDHVKKLSDLVKSFMAAKTKESNIITGEM